jgi:hypothetical protein
LSTALLGALDAFGDAVSDRRDNAGDDEGGVGATLLCEFDIAVAVAREAFVPVIALASTQEEWLRSPDAAIAGRGVGTPEARREVVRRHDGEGWVDRYEALLLAPPRGKTQTAQIDHGVVSGIMDMPNVDVRGTSSWRA